MRILVTPSDSLGDLVAYLRRCGCSADIVGFNAVEASPPPCATVNIAYLRMELDAYLRVWRARHPDAGAEILGRSVFEPVETTQTPWMAAEAAK